ncbi:MAG: hypothetical protein CVT80_06915 [Alphaproteobacteria bacterium HGW-Alphaproteobacteria-2]|nr:MAG: hypothetical protein CVT80_06915 [Alphaproteobacteria bacterium HGW-Alphaproteobacteria-2]
MVRAPCAHVLTTVALLTPAAAEAHAFGARYDLPIPLGAFLAAAAAAVALSFLGAGILLKRESARTIGVDLRLPRFAMRAGHLTLRAVGIGVLLLVLTTGFFGPQNATHNFATIAVWVLWWVGFLLFSALVIGLWHLADPLRSLHAGLDRLRGSPGQLAVLPAAAGWLAPAGLLAIAWLELVSDLSEWPAALAALIGLYCLVTLAGAARYGCRWFETADPLSRIFALLARMAPVELREKAVLRLRPPAEGLLDAPRDRAGETTLVIFLISMVLFDGLSETPLWAGLLDAISQSQTLRGGLLVLRDAGVDLMKLIRSIGLFGTVAAFLGFYFAIALLMRAAAGGEFRTAEVAAVMAGALLPIAVAYHLSHYISYLAIAGQLAIPAASDPFGLGWNLFGGANRVIDIGVIGAEQVWWVAVTALVAGHALSVVLAHRLALRFFATRRQALKALVPMTVAMIGLTVLSLWILAQPIVA